MSYTYITNWIIRFVGLFCRLVYSKLITDKIYSEKHEYCNDKKLSSTTKHLIFNYTIDTLLNGDKLIDT